MLRLFYEMLIFRFEVSVIQSSYETEMEPVRIFSTQPINFKIYAGWLISEWPGRPVFYRKFLFTVECSLIKIFQKRGRSMGEVLKFGTSDEGLRKKMLKYFGVFCKQKTQF